MSELMKELSITVRDMAGIDKVRPVTGGVPIAEGAAPKGTLPPLQKPPSTGT